jgi:hypothetical protein
MNDLYIAVLILASSALTVFLLWQYQAGASFRFEQWLDMVAWRTVRLINRIKAAVINSLPDWLIYACASEVYHYAVSSKFKNTDPHEIRAITALRRWKNK